jgi:hypothetical protein
MTERQEIRNVLLLIEFVDDTVIAGAQPVFGPIFEPVIAERDVIKGYRATAPPRQLTSTRSMVLACRLRPWKSLFVGFDRERQ